MEDPTHGTKTLMEIGQVWRSRDNGRLFRVEAKYPPDGKYPGNRWKVRRGDGATEVLPEVVIYAKFEPFNIAGFEVTMADGSKGTVVPTLNAPGRRLDS